LEVNQRPKLAFWKKKPLNPQKLPATFESSGKIQPQA